MYIYVYMYIYILSLLQVAYCLFKGVFFTCP